MAVFVFLNYAYMSYRHWCKLSHHLLVLAVFSEILFFLMHFEGMQAFFLATQTPNIIQTSRNSTISSSCISFSHQNANGLFQEWSVNSGSEYENDGKTNTASAASGKWANECQQNLKFLTEQWRDISLGPEESVSELKQVGCNPLINVMIYF